MSSRCAATLPACLALVLVTGLVGLGAPETGVAAGLRHVVVGSDEKPPDPAYFYVPQAFDCSAAVDTLVYSAGETDGLAGDTTGGTRQVASYACAPWNEPGPEHVYRVELAEDLELSVALRGDLAAVDHDLFLLGSCDTDDCLAGANTEFTAKLDAGVYYVVVDATTAAGPDQGPYTLEIETRHLGVPPRICEPGAAELVVCSDVVQQLDGNVMDRPDLMRTYDCAPGLYRGGEAWYVIPVPADNTLHVTTTTDVVTLDNALWLFGACGPEAVCLGFEDEKTGGETERLDWLNDTGGDAAVYLGVDCFSAPGDSTGGAFTLEISCEGLVPVEEKPLGSFKALFR